MNLKKENDLLEQALSVAEEGYEKAYRFLLDAYEKAPGEFGPQTLYFLACLSGGAGLSGEALGWLRTSIRDNGWWYRPEVLIDDDLAALEEDPEFLALRAASDARYSAAVRVRTVSMWATKHTRPSLMPPRATVVLPISMAKIISKPFLPRFLLL